VDRDDNAAAWPQNYEIYEFNLTAEVPNPYDTGKGPVRRIHGRISIPNT